MTGRLPGATTAPSPHIEHFPAVGDADGTALIIFPGGGYGGLAAHEGEGYAEFFSRQGIACFVVSYRLGSAGFRHPAMLEDALAAIHTVRSQADELGVDASRIGVMGSSAGGHLTAHALVAYNEYSSEVSLRPDFGILCYPVISSETPHCHQGSFRNLLGENASEKQRADVSCELRVTSETPPCFLWHTVEDGGVPVENSLLFAGALRRHGVPFALHVYPYGRHGLGLGAPFAWGEECVRWIREDTAR